MCVPVAASINRHVMRTFPDALRTAPNTVVARCAPLTKPSWSHMRAVERFDAGPYLIRQVGALAAYCWVADPPGRARAWTNVVSIARGLILDDGSDVEGSPGYAIYIEKLMHQAEELRRGAMKQSPGKGFTRKR